MATFGTFTAGQVLTAAELNTAGAWSDYTPTWTQSATITKTVNLARYTQLGKWVQCSVKMTASSAGTANNKVLVGLPVNAASTNHILGTAYVYDDSVTDKYRFQEMLFCLYESATTMSFSLMYDTASNGNATTDVRLGQNFTGNGGARTGWTIASGDIMYMQFAYEAA